MLHDHKHLTKKLKNTWKNFLINMEDSNINIPTEIEANKTKKTQKKKRSRKGSKETTESPKTNYQNVLQRRVQKGHKCVNTLKCKEAKSTQYK